MGRLLELILFAFLLWLAFEGLKARVRAFFSGASPGTPPRNPARPAARGGETLVRCVGCGIHVPRSRALPGRDGKPDLYCSERCQTAGALPESARPARP